MEANNLVKVTLMVSTVEIRFYIISTFNRCEEKKKPTQAEACRWAKPAGASGEEFGHFTPSA